MADIQRRSRFDSTPMVQSVADDSLLTSVPTIDEVLGDHASDLRHDFTGYRNHVYRVVNFCTAIVGDRGDLEKVAVAAAFHDLGIWTNKTFDYIPPSLALAREYPHGARTGGLDCGDPEDDRGPPQNHAVHGESKFARRAIPTSRLDRCHTWAENVRCSTSVHRVSIRHVAERRISLAPCEADHRKAPHAPTHAVADGQTVMATRSGGCRAVRNLPVLAAVPARAQQRHLTISPASVVESPQFQSP